MQDLETTIQSVAAQNYDNMEFVVIDGGSQDGTDEVLKRHMDNIDICVSEPDNGIYDAMNKGLRLCHGEWVIFMNAGDIFASNDVLEKIFRKGIPEGRKFVYSDSILEYADGRTLTRPMDRTKGLVHHQNAIYRRSLHDTYGYYTVTHPYIISDLMFFLAVPQELFWKTEKCIGISKDGGVSTGTWVYQQCLCIWHIYGICSFQRLIFCYVKMQISRLLRWLHIMK